MWNCWEHNVHYTLSSVSNKRITAANAHLTWIQYAGLVWTLNNMNIREYGKDILNIELWCNSNVTARVLACATIE